MTPTGVRPQHFRPPVNATTQLSPSLVLTAAAPDAKPVTPTGVKETELPSPGNSPQHSTAPAVVSAQVRWRLADIDATPDKPTTSTGVFDATFVPSPRSPSSLVPQHLAAP